MNFDFSKTFDKIPHDRLLSKVRAQWIDGKLLHWIKSWLSDRQQRVTINGSSPSVEVWERSNKWSATEIYFGAITILNIH